MDTLGAFHIMIILSQRLRKQLFWMGLLTLVVGLIAQPGFAQDDSDNAPAPMLQPKYQTETPQGRPTGKNRKKGTSTELTAEDTEQQSSTPRDRAVSLSLLVITPLLHQDTYDGTFQAYGAWVSFSFPLTKIFDNGLLFLETGPSFLYASVALTSPVVNFSHLYFDLPVRLRLVLPLAKRWEWELAAGAQFKIFQYDSRATVEGGFKSVSPLTVDPDFALGVAYQISEKTRLRFTAGYLYFGMGTEFSL